MGEITESAGAQVTAERWPWRDPSGETILRATRPATAIQACAYDEKWHERGQEQNVGAMNERYAECTKFSISRTRWLISQAKRLFAHV